MDASQRTDLIYQWIILSLDIRHVYGESENTSDNCTFSTLACFDVQT